ncbi:type VI secretion system-associated protein VasI [Pseudomonas mosselii]|uniref:Type VI secretion system-associated protein TagO n=1 Tax=Pseudomonas mosselii TaxID=78327 RepID=A0ABX9AUR8_9PSED|nr:type VI secretion system-associated protein VasI [Pseudomonas mosselii]QZP24607.1 type VI secretion system-associated protein TagO [Pseudomonas mosselii]
MCNPYSCVLGLAWFALLEPTFAAPVRDCTGIVSNVERLACFDEAAGTPARVPAIGRRWSAPELDAPSVARVMANEARRAPDNLAFILGFEDDKRTGRRQVVISAPAIATSEPRPYLAVSCVQNISRLQLLTAEPVQGNRVTLQLRTEHRSTRSLAWQVLENGQVLDAGRGLPAIEQIKVLQGAQRILVVSDHPALDGLRFDAQGLDPLIDQARTACRW